LLEQANLSETKKGDQEKYEGEKSNGSAWKEVRVVPQNFQLSKTVRPSFFGVGK
jgi:hypothetical protein